MRRYGSSTNYLQLKDKDKNKGATLYIEGRPKTTRNIAGFMNNTQPWSTLKKPNCIFEGREGKCVFLCAIKSIAMGEELLINNNLNRVDTNTVGCGTSNNLPNILLIILTYLGFFISRLL